jgi:predicted RNA-binding Zn ribbon-like protein
MESPRQSLPRTFPLLGEPLAVDLVNTVAAVGPNGALVDLIARPDGLRAWLDAQAERLDAEPESIGALLGDLHRLQALREALRSLLRAAMRNELPDMEALALVNAMSAAAPCAPVLDWPSDGPPLARSHREAHEPAARPLAAIARSGIELLGSEQLHALRTCQGPGCVLIFVAANARRHWCSPAICGNRVRVARHYQRRHGLETVPERLQVGQDSRPASSE